MNAGHPESLQRLDLPQSDVGAPLPRILADEHRLAIVYRVAEPDPNSDGSTIRMVDGDEDEPCAVVIASPYMALQLGPPNDEAMDGHRFAPLGIDPYSTYEVLNSAWIAELETRNRVHPHHRPEYFSSQRHFIFTFHDSSLEFIADGFTIEVRRGRLRKLLLEAFETAR